MKHKSIVHWVLPALVSGASLVALGCGSNGEDKPLPNQNPFVEITGGPLEGSSASYTARILWRGWDGDGIITHYEYALDPPTVFSQEEIESPETAPGLTLRVIPGPLDDTDTLRVTKTVDGTPYSFDWVETREFSRIFAFQTLTPDSIVEGGVLKPDDQYSGVHVVYVRALDNEGMFSDTDHLGFTATTITPTSEIKRPGIDKELLNLGVTLTVRWDGIDPDARSADKKPVGYFYKLLRLDIQNPKIPPVPQPDLQLMFRLGEWVYQSAETTDVTLQLTAGGQYLFAVRAVDEAGGIEPVLAYGQNAFVFQSLSGGGRPTLFVSEPGVGTFDFRGTSDCVEVEVPSGAKLFFRWRADVEEYGGTVEGYSWGIDIPDLDVEGPQSGWSSWDLNNTGNFDPISFPVEGVHNLYVRVRDISGAMTLACMTLRVIEFTFSREVLWVDDSFDGNFPSDSQHDAFWRSMFQYYADNSDFETSDFSEIQAHGAQDREILEPAPVELSDMGNYKMILWENLGSGYNGVSSLLKSSMLSPRLGAYLGAGGKLWVGGRLTVGAMVRSENNVNANLVYPKEEMNAEDFAYTFMKLHTTFINNDKGSNQQHTLVRAKPFPGKPEIYPFMEYDPVKLNLAQLGIPHCDTVWDPIFAESEPGFRGDVDSLYIYGAQGPEVAVPPRSSSYQDRLMAIRWHDPDPDRRHGRVQWFGFALYFFQYDHAKETFKRSMDWFREEQIPETP